MNIGEAAITSGVSAKMIRYYEQIGLIPSTSRTPAGYRVYSASDVHTLCFVRRARDLGLSIEEMNHLLDLWHDRTRASADVRRIAIKHIAGLEQKKRKLRAMTQALQHLADNCQGDDRPQCPILTDLEGGAAEDSGPVGVSS